MKWTASCNWILLHFNFHFNETIPPKISMYECKFSILGLVFTFVWSIIAFPRFLFPSLFYNLPPPQLHASAMQIFVKPSVRNYLGATSKAIQKFRQQKSHEIGGGTSKVSPKLPSRNESSLSQSSHHIRLYNKGLLPWTICSELSVMVRTTIASAKAQQQMNVSIRGNA